MRRILITGGTGYLGGELVRLAAAAGWSVGATYFSQLPLPVEGVDWLPLDVRDSLAVEELLDSFQPDAVIHTVFRQSEPDLMDVTAGGAGSVARAARNLNVRLIHLSSDVIFDGEAAAPYTEADPPSPITDYGRAKAAAEELVADAHPDAAIVRTSLIYGFTPMDRHSRFVLELADGRQEGQLFTDELRCPIFVGDLARALLELLQTSHQGVINIAGAETVSRYEFGALIAQAYDRDPGRLQSGLSAASALRRPRNCALDIHLATRLLHTPLRGVRAVFSAFRRQETGDSR